MAQTVIHTKMSRAEVYRELRRLPKLLSGNPGQAGGAVAALQVRLGETALNFIAEAMIQKASGGTDEAGQRWAPLSPKTIAYSRRIKGVPEGKQRAARAPSWALTRAQRKRWWTLYSKFGGTRSKGRAYHAPGSRSHAAARAWRIIKDEGAKTLMMLYGNRKVQILRDSGVLFSSLSPGVVVGDARPPVPPPMPPRQIFRRIHGAVIVGTNRRFAGTHHNGVPGRIPQRRLWPKPSQWPTRWWTALTAQARMGCVDVISWLLRK